ncbi:helix-turn-helix domain-containing protein [bacterium]|nr:helix-turn-helix domain-containing protein [bacterium]
MNNALIKFGDFLRDQRLRADLTQMQLAQKLDVSQNFVTYLEKGQRKPTNEMIKKISKILSVSTDKLYFLANPDVSEIVDFDEEEGRVAQKMPPALEALMRDSDLRERNRITDEDIKQLASMRLRGDVKRKEDYLFLLLSIRQVLR